MVSSKVSTTNVRYLLDCIVTRRTQAKPVANHFQQKTKKKTNQATKQAKTKRTSAPSPNRNPSLNRVLQFAKTHAESTAFKNFSRTASSSVTTHSVWLLLLALMCAIAASTSSTTSIMSVRSPYSTCISSVVGSCAHRRSIRFRPRCSNRCRFPGGSVACCALP